MSQVITNAFEQYWQSCLAAEKPVVLDEFILADIPNLDITSPIDPDTGLPPQSQIVHRQSVDQRGRINNNAVAYTIVMDTTVGDFSFNAMYLRNKQNGVIGMIVYKGRETKLKTDQTTGQTGNSLVKSMLMGYDQAAEATLTNVDAGTWQIDYAARLRGMDEDLRQLTSQLYGHHTFVGDGFKVVEKGDAYQVTQGVAIVGGLRVELKAPEVIHPGTKPIGVWVDVHRAGSLLSEHQNHFTIITSVADLTDHVDSNGYQHYVAKLGTVQADNTVVDGRGITRGDETSIPESLSLLEQADAMLAITSWEALRRSYAEAGYNVVGTFQAGFTIVKARDVGIDEVTGKGYTGPSGVVAPDTDPTSGGFVDVSPFTHTLTPDYTPFNSLSDKAMYMLGKGLPFNMGQGTFVFEKPVILPNLPGTIPAIRGQGNATKVVPGFNSETDSVFQFIGVGPNDFIRAVEIYGFEWSNPNKYRTGIIDIYQCLRGITTRDITGFFAPRGIRVRNSYGASKIENIRLYLYDTVEFNHAGTYGVICESNAVNADTIETVGGYEIGQRYNGDSVQVANYNSAGADDSPRNMIRKAIDVTGRQVVLLKNGYIERPFVPDGVNVNDVITCTIANTDQLSLDGLNMGAGSALISNCRGVVDNIFLGTNSNWIAYDEKCEIREGLITHYSAESPSKPITGSFWGKHSSGKITREIDYNPAGYIPVPYFKSPFLFSTDSPSYRGLSTTAGGSVATVVADKGACFEYTAPQFQGGSFYVTGLKPSRYYTVMFRIESVGDFKTYIIPETFSPQVSDKPATFYAKGVGNDVLCYVVLLSTASGAIGCRIVHDNPALSVFRVYSTQIVEGVATTDVYADVFDIGVDILSTPYKIPAADVANYNISVTNSGLVTLSNAQDGRLRVTTTSNIQGVLITVSALQDQMVTCKAVVSDVCSVMCFSGHKERLRLSDNKSRGTGLIEANAFVNAGSVAFRISKDVAGVFDVSSIHISVK